MPGVPEQVRALVRTHFFDVQTTEQLTHTYGVVGLALQLARNEIDRVDAETLELVEITALLHDICGWTWNEHGRRHPIGIDLAHRWLTELRYPKPLCETVLGALQGAGVVCGVVHDAVALEALGLVHLSDARWCPHQMDELLDCWRTSTVRALTVRVNETREDINHSSEGEEDDHDNDDEEDDDGSGGEDEEENDSD